MNLMEMDRELSKIEAVIAKGNTSPDLLGELAKLEAAIDVASMKYGYSPGLLKAQARDLYDDIEPEGTHDEEPDSTDPRELDASELDDNSSNDDNDTEDELSVDNNRRRLGKAASTGAHPFTSKFEAVAQRISAARNVPMTEALVIARKENPTLYQSYQDSGLQNNAQESGQQLMIPSEGIVKLSNDYQARVQEHMAKGCSREVAEQRVAGLYPKETNAHIQKSSEGVADFVSVVTRIMKRDGTSRTVAMQKARHEHPAAFARYQNV